MKIYKQLCWQQMLDETLIESGSNSSSTATPVITVEAPANLDSEFSQHHYDNVYYQSCLPGTTFGH